MIVTIDPSTGAVRERIAPMSADDLDEAAGNAVAAARVQAAASPSERASVLASVAAAMRAERDSLAATAVGEMGKPIVQARAEIEKCAWTLEYFAERGPAMLAEQDAPSNAAHSFVAFRPLGVILAIMPWNFPYWQVVRAAAPALMAGNAILLKHAPNTTRCGLELHRVFERAGAPEGLFQTLVIGDREADLFIADPRVAAVTLTGSERAGVAVASAAGAALKKCVLELGGSDAFVVLPDADLDAAAATAVQSRFNNNGQSCIAAKRFIVAREVHGAFLERFEAKVKALAIGDPRDEATTLGPVARGDLLKTLHDQVRTTVERGARLVTGGHPLDRPGYFYDPAIVDGVVPGMRMFDEEVFGPAAAVIEAAGVHEAIELANASAYGLGCSIWTQDAKAAEALAATVQAGAVFINGMVASDPRLPFGGVKKSGYGRELSHFGLHEFANIQTVWRA